MKKYTAILLAALMLLGALSGCAKKNTTAAAETADAAGTQTTATGTAATGTAATTEDQGLLGDILKKGVLTISLSPDFAPMEFVDTSKQGQDQYVGFDVTLAKYIADQLGVTLQIEAMEFSACQAAVQMGRVDMSISGYSKTADREKAFDFSDFYYAGDNESEQCIMVLKDNLDKYSTAESFKGAKVGAQLASLQYNLLTEQLPDAEAVEISDLNTAVLELINGKIDALCVAKGNGEAFMANYDTLALSPWEFTVEDEGNVVLLPKGETALQSKINEILTQAYSQNLYGQWYDDAKAASGLSTASEVTLPADSTTTTPSTTTPSTTTPSTTTPSTTAPSTTTP